jgi:hypothetical protein
MSLRKWTVQRCHGQPSTCAIAAFRPAWASEMHSRTPSRPRSRKPLRNARQNASVSASVHVQADHLPAAALVHAVGDHQRLVAHPAGLADPLHLGVQPQVGIGALQRPLAEDPDLLIQAPAQPGDLVLAQVVQAQLLHQPVDLTGRNPVHVRLLDDRDQCLLGTPARLQEAREVRAGPKPGDGQLDAAHPGIPVAGPVAVAVRGPLQAALAELGADLGADLGLHQLACHPGHALAQHIGVLVLEELVGKLGSGHPGPLGHRVCLLRRSAGTDRRS